MKVQLVVGTQVSPKYLAKAQSTQMALLQLKALHQPMPQLALSRSPSQRTTVAPTLTTLPRWRRRK